MEETCETLTLINVATHPDSHLLSRFVTCDRFGSNKTGSHKTGLNKRADAVPAPEMDLDERWLTTEHSHIQPSQEWRFAQREQFCNRRPIRQSRFYAIGNCNHRRSIPVGEYGG